MQKEFEMEKIKKSSGNVYKDLEVANPEQMLIKATLAAKIGEILAQQKITQVEAAKLLGIPQPKVSALLRGQFRGISEAKMLECLNRLGRDIDIVVRTPSRTRADGRINVVFT